MKHFLLNKWEFVLAFCVLFYVMAQVISTSLEMNDGALIYALDDAYIHMSMAKNLILHKVWGITEHGFTSSSSSIIWPLLISFFYLIFGINEHILMIMNLVLGVILLYAAHFILKKHNINSYLQTGLLVAVIFLAPLPALIVSGMEHILQIITYILAIYFAARLAAGEAPPDKEKRYRVYLLCILTLASLTRYEGFMLTGLVAFLFMLKKELKFPLVILAASFAPIAVYGLISIFNGWYFLPNSVILKGIHPAETISDMINLLYNRYELLGYNLHVLYFLVITPVMLAVYCVRKKKADSAAISLALTAALIILHALFFRYNWFFRYEAYIIVISLLFNVIALVKVLNVEAFKGFYALSRASFKRAGIIAVQAAFIGFLGIYLYKTHGERAILGTKWAPVAMNDRYIEHVYTAKFLQEYYNTSTVVLNDVGAAGFFTRAKILDIYGLASFEPAKFAPYLFTSRTDVFRSKTSTYRQEFDKWIEGNKGEIAVLQTGGWYIRSFIPSEWEKIGMWEIPSNVVFGDREISFYCINPAERERMIQALRKFSAKLPKAVFESGKYTRVEEPGDTDVSLTANLKKNLLSPVIQF